MNTESFSLEALRAGDRAEFSRLVEAYSGRLYRLALKMLADPQDAEDVLQETFFKAIQHIKNFDGRSSLSTWLYRIATNEALMLLRRKRPDTISIDQANDDPESERGFAQEPMQIKDWCCLPERELVSAEARQRLDEAVAQLSPNLRIVFLLRDVEDLSTRETADALNISEEAVKTRLSRARFRLREILTAFFGERLEAMSDGTR